MSNELQEVVECFYGSAQVNLAKSRKLGEKVLKIPILPESERAFIAYICSDLFKLQLLMQERYEQQERETKSESESNNA